MRHSRSGYGGTQNTHEPALSTAVPPIDHGKIFGTEGHPCLRRQSIDVLYIRNSFEHHRILGGPAKMGLLKRNRDGRCRSWQASGLLNHSQQSTQIIFCKIVCKRQTAQTVPAPWRQLLRPVQNIVYGLAHLPPEASKRKKKCFGLTCLACRNTNGPTECRVRQRLRVSCHCLAAFH